MTPRGKLFLGLSVLLGGVVLVLFAGVYATISRETASGLDAAGSSDQVDSLLETTHTNVLLAFGGISLGLVLLAGGMILVGIATHQTLRAKSQRQA